MKKNWVFAVIALAFMSQRVFAQPGTLDASFNATGVKNIPFVNNVSSDSAAASIVQTDGKLVLALIGTNSTTGDKEAIVTRLLANGSVDNSFGINGKANLTTILSGFIPRALAVKTSGVIIIAGYYPPGNGNVIPALISLKGDGSVNEFFGTLVSSPFRSGYVTLPVGSSYDGNAFQTVQVHPTNGSIYASGGLLNHNNSNFSSFFVAAFNAFGDGLESWSNPVVQLSVFEGGGSQWVNSSVIHATSNTLYLAGGAMFNDETYRTQFAVAAINTATGDFRTSFFYDQVNGYGGAKALPANNSINECTSIRFSVDSSNLYLGGYSSSFDPSDAQFMLYKVKRIGKIDSTFATDGIGLYSIPTTISYNKAYSLAVLPTGQLVLGGTASKSTYYWAAVGIRANGDVERNFGTLGYLYYNGANNKDTLSYTNGITSMHTLSSGQLLLVGTSYNTNADVVIKRINADGSNDNSYGYNSNATVWAMDEDAVLVDLAVNPNNNTVWVCGYSAPTSTNQIPYVALLNADGSINKAISLIGFYPGLTGISNPTIGAITLTDQGEPLVAGTYQVGVQTNNIFVIKLSATGTPLSFNGALGYSKLSADGLGTYYLNDIVIQPNKGILVYAGIDNYLSVVRFKLDGTIDPTFTTYTSTISGSSNKQEIKVQANNMIVGVTTLVSTTSKFMAFRLQADGAIDTGFGNNGTQGIFTGNVTSNSYSDFASSLLIQSDQKIVIGGYSQQGKGRDYAMIRLNSDGKVDNTFGNLTAYPGSLLYDAGSPNDALLSLYQEDSTTITATGALTKTTNHFYLTAMRFLVKGNKFDNTFGGQGHVVLNYSYPFNAVWSGSSLYVGGATKKLDGAYNYYGQVTKIKLGSGPVIKHTDLSLANLNKTYGDDPFLLKPITNSPAPVYYIVAQSACATVNPTTGLLKITCATVDSGIDIVIDAIQPAISGYTGDTTSAIIHVAKAIPVITFANAGGLVGDTIGLAAISSSGVTPSYYVVTGTSAYLLPSNFATNQVKIATEGSTTFQAYFESTQNYEGAYATALVTGQTSIQAPDANDDQAQLIFGTQDNTTIRVLANDEAYSGVIVADLTDLDPSTAAIDTVYVSPSLGLFQIDSTGLVTYTPFSGFIGSGYITYTITDSRQTVSAPGKINIKVTSQSAIPDLKATELITPNNDGLNDAFVIGYVNLEKENHLRVFDRNGQELYSKDNYANDWSGTLANGKQAENGIYYYLFTEGSSDDQRELKGVVEIKR